jgi:hypothetical protein
MDKPQETDLLARLADEKLRRKAFEELVNTFSESLYWQIRKWCNNPRMTPTMCCKNTLIKVWSTSTSSGRVTIVYLAVQELPTMRPTLPVQEECNAM